MGGNATRLAVGLLAIATAVGLIPNAPAAASVGAPVWLPVAPAPMAPRSGAGLVALSPTSVLAFGGFSWSTVLVTNVGSRDVLLPVTDTAVFDEATMLWRRTAPLPPGVSWPAVSGPWLNPVGAEGFAYLTAAQTNAAGTIKNVVLRYAASTDSWDVFPAPPVKPTQLIAAGKRLVALDTQPDHPGSKPSGAVLDEAEQWRALPPDPFPTQPFLNPQYDPNNRKFWGRPDARFHWVRDGVWTGKRLLLVGGPEKGPHAAVAALDFDQLGRPAGGWTRLPDVSDPKGRWTPDRQLSWQGGRTEAATYVAGRVVYSNVVYDPASGASTPTPTSGERPSEVWPFGDDRATLALGDLPPDGLVFGNRVVLGGTLFDPVSGSSEPCPRLLSMAQLRNSKAFPIGLGPGGGGWIGGPGGILHFGGDIFAGGYPAATHAPAVPPALLRPVA